MSKIDSKIKARITSLSKKTNEELINIILRKDKTERSLNQKVEYFNEVINSHKTTIYNLNKKLENIIADCAGTDATFNLNKIELDKLKRKYNILKVIFVVIILIMVGVMFM